MSAVANMAASADSRGLFTDGVRAALHTWPVLQIALDNGFGGVYGEQKADWLVDVVQQYFHDNADLEQDEVEDFISTLMDQEFHTVVDDGSLPQVCVRLMQMFCQWQQGALQQLSHSIQLLTQNKPPRAKVAAPPTQSDSDSDGETQVMEFESTSANTKNHHPHEDEDGWTLVGKRK
ncbi:pre-rRNA-processing protein TSR2 homolog isoform X1 [Phyllopteryx taeniolatus]|uniref:pre-rRNA-processing protein TSR2 homolog isoform X1 n=1 Tax=Phyllopteryx taeniolatus TaxID=161469 RepID=UPI002AD4A3D5|nr:pre-rRNA-processing protein TSR2 homolog isoform X1 [Phyllopteryx taeniolatus]XP_061644118.1 pre-rRNA-processing protein TSR2 homolog isoform X1 [Phyllopteryx taeniolatus]